MKPPESRPSVTKCSACGSMPIEERHWQLTESGERAAYQKRYRIVCKCGLSGGWQEQSWPALAAWNLVVMEKR